MVSTMNGVRMLLTAFALSLLAACAGDRGDEPDVASETPDTETQSGAQTPPAVPSGSVGTEDLDDADSPFGDATQSSLEAYAQGDRVYFDFDQSGIRGDARPVLRRMAEWLAHHDDVRFTIAGHCDRRGTRDYNLALGERRAASVRDYLVAQGISARRIRTISYGKERLAEGGGSERTHQLNRRGVITLN